MKCLLNLNYTYACSDYNGSWFGSTYWFIYFSIIFFFKYKKCSFS